MSISQRMRRFAALVFVFSLLSSASAPVKWRVRGVEFTGNSAYSSKALVSLMELKPKWPGYKTRYTDFLMRQDLDVLRNFYRSVGFENAEIKTERVVRDSSKGMVWIYIAINEGPRTRVDDVRIAAGRFKMKPADMKKLQTKPGQPLIHADVLRDTRLIKDMLGNEGFLEAEVNPVILHDSVSNLADVVFDVREGPKIRVGSITLEGNKGVANTVVSRELDFRCGDTLKLKAVRNSERRLYTTGLFNYVGVSAHFDSGAVAADYPDSAYDVRVRVTPSDFFRLQGGPGYSTDEGARLSVLTSYRNLFGLGHAITLDGKASQVSQRAEAKYLAPWPFYFPVYFETKLYYSRYDNPELYQGVFDGVRFAVGRQTDYNILYQVWTQWENVQWVRAPDEDNVPADLPDYPTQSIGSDISFDTRNDLFNPSSGCYNYFGLEVAGVFGGNSNRFVKGVFDTRWYFNHRMRYFLSTALRAGRVEPYGISEAVPVQRKFFGGGGSTVRGFDVNRLAVLPNNDPLKGNFYLFANIADIRFPLFWWINGAVFLDAGNVWPEYTDMALAKDPIGDLRWAAGPGIRVDTPIKLVARLDLGFKLDRRPGESAMALHFDLGQPF